MRDFIRNLDFFRTDSNALVSTLVIIWACIFGLICALAILFYKRKVLGAFVRAIRHMEATDEASAKTLSELAQNDNVSAISALKKSVSMQNLVTICNDGKTDPKGRPIIDETTRFYIPADKDERARKQYGDEEESVLPIVLASIVLVVLGVLSFFII